MDHITHKRGDSFEILATVPQHFADGYFVGWSVASQVRRLSDSLIADLDVTWLNDKVTRHLRLQKIETKTWPVGKLLMDIQFVREDGYTISTKTMTLLIEKDITGE